MPSKLPEDPSNLNILLTTTKKEMIYNIPVNTRWYPLIPVDTRNTRKYPKYPKIPESKRDTRKYPIAYFDTPTRPEPDPIPGILSNTRPDPTRYWKTLPAGHWCQIVPLCLYTRKTRTVLPISESGDSQALWPDHQLYNVYIIICWTLWRQSFY